VIARFPGPSTRNAVASKNSQSRLGPYRKKRDFARTPEPTGGSGATGNRDRLRFVVQKHAASHLHFDLRLEMDGVMRSWAVPKGPSLDPAVRRLAMEVEDHPIEYNDFEGIIPQGEYGGGTVMLWDRGHYSPEDRKKAETAVAAALRGYRAGKLSLTLQGERLRGSFGLVRTDAVEGGVRSKWLFFKHADEHASPGEEITDRIGTSVATGRTMEEIAAGKGGERVWRSNREESSRRPRSTRSRSGGEAGAVGKLLPMLATTGQAVPSGAEWTFEPKYDGIRVLAFATPETAALITRNGRDKAAQFPEVAAELEELSATLGRPVVLDGELVALEGGRVARFERLQGRMHLQDGSRSRRQAEANPAALMAFDLLLDGEAVLVHEEWGERRAALERLLEGRQTETIRLAETLPDAELLLRRGRREGWEGIMAKRTTARYRPGQRSSDWLKLKLRNRQELVVGGWTEPRKSRAYLGAILLGYYDPAGDFVYAGHTGTGFTREQLADMYRRLKRLERKTPPFRHRPRTNETAHWVTPKVVVEVEFNEWTRDGKLRQPVFRGIRTDKDAKEVVREPGAARPLPERDTAAAPASRPAGPAAREAGSPKAAARGPRKRVPAPADDPLTDDDLDTPTARRIRTVSAQGGGELKLGKGSSLGITSPEKVFFPETGHSKQDLLVYYARMADHILRWMRDRPLVLKRFPNGVEGESFYQQAAPDAVPPGVRVEALRIEGKDQRRLVGGNLATMLYTVQLGAVSYDPWHSRVGDLDSADYTVLDLDPGPGTPFERVVEVARWTKEEMDQLGLRGALKTSGSTGLHIYLPLPPATPLEAATLTAQIVATRVAQKHPKEATVERMTKNRPPGTVYVDYLQNILGKTVAGVYAARAKAIPTVSTPLEWDELTDGLDLRDFTIDTVPARVRQLGDLWSPAMRRPNDLQRLIGSVS
jgi:bifunctional non-homologous end joining protein LigD